MTSAKITTERVFEDGEQRVRLEVNIQGAEGTAVSMLADGDGLVDLQVIRAALRMLIQNIEVSHD